MHLFTVWQTHCFLQLQKLQIVRHWTGNSLNYYRSRLYKFSRVFLFFFLLLLLSIHFLHSSFYRVFNKQLKVVIRYVYIPFTWAEWRHVYTHFAKYFRWFRGFFYPKRTILARDADNFFSCKIMWTIGGYCGCMLPTKRDFIRIFKSSAFFFVCTDTCNSIHQKRKSARVCKRFTSKICIENYWFNCLLYFKNS